MEPLLLTENEIIKNAISLQNKKIIESLSKQEKKELNRIRKRIKEMKKCRQT